MVSGTLHTPRGPNQACDGLFNTYPQIRGANDSRQRSSTSALTVIPKPLVTQISVRMASVVGPRVSADRCVAAAGHRSLVSHRIRSWSTSTDSPLRSGTCPLHAPRPSGTYPRLAYNRCAGPYSSKSPTVMPTLRRPRAATSCSAESMSAVATPQRRNSGATPSWCTRGISRSANVGLREVQRTVITPATCPSSRATSVVAPPPT